MWSFAMWSFSHGARFRAIARAATGPFAAAEPTPTRPGPAASARPARQFPPPPPDTSDDEPPLRLAPSRGPLMPPGAVMPPGPIADGPTPIFGTLTPPGTPRVA